MSSHIFVNSYLGQKSPWTKVCLDNCPLDKSLLGQLVPWTIAPWTIVATPDLVFSVKLHFSLTLYPLSLIPYPLFLIPYPLSISLIPYPLSLIPYHLSLIPYPLSLPLVPYPLVLFLSQNLGEGYCHCCDCCCDCPKQK